MDNSFERKLAGEEDNEQLAIDKQQTIGNE